MNKVVFAIILVFSISIISFNSDNAYAGITGPNPNYQTVIKQITVGTTPLGLAYSTATNELYVLNSNDHTISVIASNNTVVKTINQGTGHFPQDIAFSPTTNDIYVTNPGNSDVDIIGTSNTIIKTIPIGGSSPQSYVIPIAITTISHNQEYYSNTQITLYVSGQPVNSQSSAYSQYTGSNININTGNILSSIQTAINNLFHWK